MNAQTFRALAATAAVRRSARVAALAGGALVACTAHAGPADLGVQAVHGILAFFAEPENVRGVFGAAAGALASVIAARPLNRRGPRRSDDA